MFQKPEGFVSVEWEPDVGESGIKSYGMNLVFTTIPNAPINADQNFLAKHADVAHMHLERFFFGLLKKPYLKYLRSK